jgi:hypothetical protein
MAIPESVISSFVFRSLFINERNFVILINFYRAYFLSFGEYLLAIVRFLI